MTTRGQYLEHWIAATGYDGDPEEFPLPAEWREWSLAERIDLNPDRVWEQFRDYWLSRSGQIARKRRWFATWRNWVRSQKRNKDMENWKSWVESDIEQPRSDPAHKKLAEAKHRYFVKRGDILNDYRLSLIDEAERDRRLAELRGGLM